MQFKRLIECTSVSAFSLIAFTAMHSQAAQDRILTPQPIPVQQPGVIIGQPSQSAPAPLATTPSLYQEWDHYYPELESAPSGAQYPGTVIGEVTLPSISELEAAHELAIEKIEKEIELLQEENDALLKKNND